VQFYTYRRIKKKKICQLENNKSSISLIGPEVLFKTCIAMKFVDDDNDD